MIATPHLRSMVRWIKFIWTGRDINKVNHKTSRHYTEKVKLYIFCHEANIFTLAVLFKVLLPLLLNLYQANGCTQKRPLVTPRFRSCINLYKSFH